jgi:N-methylhydantoinase A
MVSAIAEVTISQGLDPRESSIVAGGGAAGLGIIEIARSLGLERVIVPRTAGALSAFGGQHADIVAEASRSLFARSDAFPHDDVARLLADLEHALERMRNRLADSRTIEQLWLDRAVDARYANQAWELEIPIPEDRVSADGYLETLVQTFHQTHQRIFAVHEPAQVVEMTHWRVRLRARPGRVAVSLPSRPADGGSPKHHRLAYFPQSGEISIPVYEGPALPQKATVEGPAVIAEPTTTIVIPPGATATTTSGDSYVLQVQSA